MTKERKKVFGKGINDMPRGWAVESEWNRRAYKTWLNMLMRVYSSKWHEKYPTYKDVEVCERWLHLSNFVEDLPKIEGFEKWLKNVERIALDKDLKGQGSRVYSLENCIFVSQSENAKEVVQRCGTATPVVRISKTGEAKEYSSTLATEQDGFQKPNVVSCCKGKRKTHKGYKWMYLTDYNKLLKEGGYYV